MEKTLNRKINFTSLGLKELNEFINEYENTKKDETVVKKRLFLMIKRIVEEITETVIKINMILLNEKGHFPKSYKYSFLDLKKYYNLDENFVKELSITATFRNELAHEYIDMNEEYAIKNSKIVLKLYPKFLLEIKKIIDKI